jgi:site-specific DNA-cytosine methylase
VDPVLKAVKQKILAHGLTSADAARQIGVTPGSLEKHLAGDYVRSDSLAKYRRWEAGHGSDPQVPLLKTERSPRQRTTGLEHLVDQRLISELVVPESPHYVIDLFSGCGGLSLGFDALGGGRVFRTVLGLDIEEPMVRAFNDNFPPGPTGRPICRQVDLADFINEAEVLAFYLDHLASVTRDGALERALANLPDGPLSDFKSHIHETDNEFLAQLVELRASRDFAEAYGELESTVLGQTSVTGFQQSLGLPLLSSKRPVSPPLIWADCTYTSGQARENPTTWKPSARLQARRSALERHWSGEVAQLKEQSEATGKGQLASSSEKIARFVRFVESRPMQELRGAWLHWRTTRDCARSELFGSETTLAALRKAYTPSRHVEVILGGPPCQGFSRIGRGKIRSLREHGVHVQADAEAGDERNRLLLKYTLFVAALRPKLFLFENVRHFQAEVNTTEGTFRAPEVLADAIREISDGGTDYTVAMATVDCSLHLIPQTRERFVMAGVRSDVARILGAGDAASWCLALPVRAEVPLRTAVEGLPAPVTVGSSSEGPAMAATVDVHLDPSEQHDANNDYLNWVRQSPPPHFQGASAETVDGHVVRGCRRDDQALFALMGPGKRWMDYRCDESPTMSAVGEYLDLLIEAAGALRRSRTKAAHPALERLAQVDSDRLKKLRQSVDGSLSIRLLLECIPPLAGELQHHLLAQGYLAKSEGNHGDWLARMDSEKPSKTIVSHMAKDTYAYVHPFTPRTLSVREAARVQTFPDWFRLRSLGLVDAFRVVGNAVPPLLSAQFAERAAELLAVGAQGGNALPASKTG